MDKSYVGDSTYTLDDGRVLHGIRTGGDFVSDDGTTAVVGGRPFTGTTDFDTDVFTTPGGVEYLISDKGLLIGVQPPDGPFLPGAIRYSLPDGRQSIGYMTGDDFYSADRKTVVLSGGHMLTGTTNVETSVFTTDDGVTYFVSDKGLVRGVQPPGKDFLPGGELRTIEGKQVYGTVGPDGSFLSLDGTLYVTGTATKDASGKVIPPGTVQHGVTTPDGYFLDGGSIRTLPDGRKFYGYARGDGFITYDSKTLVLPGGKVVTGTLDPVGIFTTSDKKTFYVGDEIQPASKQVDGSYVLPDKTTVMTADSWTWDLQQLEQITQAVKSEVQPISDEIDTVAQQLSVIEASWSTPSGGSFADVAAQATSAFVTLKDMLSDLVSGMENSYANYVEVERVNNANVTGNG